MNPLIIAFIGLLTAIPLGYFLKRITSEEMKIGKKYFLYLSGLSIFVLILSLFLSIEYSVKMTLVFSSLYVGIVSFISYYSPKNK